MGYDRRDENRGHSDERPRWSDEDYRRSDRDFGGGRDERGFFERAGDQIASWFGDEDDRRRDDRDHRRDWIRDERGRGFGDRGFSERDQRERERGSFGVRPRRTEDEQPYRPMAGDYGRSNRDYRFEQRDERSAGRGEDRFREQGRFARDRGESDDQRRFPGSGPAARPGFGDRHYHESRQRHMDEFDRDYDAYRREHQSNFETDFGSWRERRQSKRGLLRDIREDMPVVGSDGGRVGTVDRVAGDRIILAKSDPEAGGAHHSLSCADLDRIEGDRLVLECSADQARRRWRDEDRERALFEREDQGRAGPHMLDRSFSGTYR